MRCDFFICWPLHLSISSFRICPYTYTLTIGWSTTSNFHPIYSHMMWLKAEKVENSVRTLRLHQDSTVMTWEFRSKLFNGFAQWTSPSLGRWYLSLSDRTNAKCPFSEYFLALNQNKFVDDNYFSSKSWTAHYLSSYLLQLTTPPSYFS